MKKSIAIILSLVFILVLSGCNYNETETVEKVIEREIMDVYVNAYGEMVILYSNGDKKTFDITGLQGENGTDGINGTNGTNGIDGKNGENGYNGTNGITPSINEDGYWCIGDTNTGVCAVGQNGKDGTTPSIEINSNGYWVINGVTTSYRAIGEKGEKGDTPVIEEKEYTYASSYYMSCNSNSYQTSYTNIPDFTFNGVTYCFYSVKNVTTTASTKYGWYGIEKVQDLSMIDILLQYYCSIYNDFCVVNIDCPFTTIVNGSGTYTSEHSYIINYKYTSLK